jgi:hypothetical protein
MSSDSSVSIGNDNLIGKENGRTCVMEADEKHSAAQILNLSQNLWRFTKPHMPLAIPNRLN